MKAGFSLATAFLAVSFVGFSNAVKLARREYEVPVKQNTEENRELTFSDPDANVDQEHRVEVRYTLSFDECNRLEVAECESIIEHMFEDDPSLFRDTDHLYFFEETLQQPGADNYNYVSMMTNAGGTHVAGHLGDGVVHYHNPNYDRENVWCTSDTPCPHEPNHLRHLTEKCCFAVGPWDCDTGVPKTPEDCCNMIKSSVPPTDDVGNAIICYTAFPLGSAQNPVDHSRIHILLDAGGFVVGEPVNE